MTNQTTNSTQPSLRALIADDAYSMTFQSLPQYRAALLQSLAVVANQPAPSIPVAWRDALRRSGATDHHGRIAFLPAQLEQFVSMLTAHQPAQEQDESTAGVTLGEALYALDLVTNKMHVPGLSGQRAFAADVLQRAAQKETVAVATDAQCTCPSGNGSLRWPCPAHPPGHDKVDTDGNYLAATHAAAQGEKA
jgi:hypothetical protein